MNNSNLSDIFTTWSFLYVNAGAYMKVFRRAMETVRQNIDVTFAMSGRTNDHERGRLLY